METDKIYRIDALGASTGDGDLYRPTPGRRLRRLPTLCGPYTRSRPTGSSTTPTTKCTPSGTISPPATTRSPPQRLLSYNDDGGEGLNARMYIRGFPAGTHYIEVTTVPHQDGPRRRNRLLHPHPDGTEDDSSSDRTVTVGTTTSGEIEYPGDTDTFVVSLDAGTEYSVQQILTGYWSGSHLINPAVENIHADPISVVDHDLRPRRRRRPVHHDHGRQLPHHHRRLHPESPAVRRPAPTRAGVYRLIRVKSNIASCPTRRQSGVPTISGTAEYGETLTANISGVTDADGIDRSTLAYQWLRNPGNGATAISGATSRTYTVVADDEENQLSVRVSFTDNADNAESVTSAEVYIQAPPPLYSAFDNVPASHDGEDSTFTVELYFNTEPSLSWRDVQNNVLTVTNGDVTYVRRTNPKATTQISAGRSPSNPPTTAT